MKLWDFLRNKMLQNPNQIVCESEAKMTYEEMVVFAEMFSKQLQGIKCCAILCNCEMMAALALVSCFADKVTAVPLSMRYGELHCNKILDTISPDAIITDFEGELQVTLINDALYKEPSIHPALIMCTSGTTGKPKGAMLSEKNIITNVSDIADYFDIGCADTILLARPLYHFAVLTGEFLTGLIKGVKIRFYSDSFNPPKMLELIKKYEITAFCGTPTLLSMMARFNRVQSTTLKHICISGECMSESVGLKISDSFNDCEIYHIYGLTEACPRVSYLPPQLFGKYPDCVGLPLKSVELKILNTDGKICAKNEEGVLWVKGDNVMLGYYEEPEKTERVLSKGWLCTGDIASINERGLLKIKGRNDQMIIKAGMNIYPTEIEASMKIDSRVKEVLVFGFETKFGTQIGMKIAGEFSGVDEVKQLCLECLPTYQIPTSLELVSELPRNGSGHIIRR